ncbi:MAG: Gfo/Idh/MocA family oxidoreductase, partial [Verrucomicrobiales bacterium]|nr:Gfo/Idh/MocA family oxidoreductase [Verrucomicrobiales bacterium]
SFLQRAGLATGGLIALPTFIPARALGRNGHVAPSERIVMGGIGIGSRGRYVLGAFLPEPGVQFVAIADPRRDNGETAKKKVDEHYGNKDCVLYRDLRELLARPDIDAVLIATGPNWHAQASILAANAGKDVYCEKPCTKTIAESLALAETFRRTGRIFQAGTQRRSLPNFAYAVELARRGKLGKLQTLHAKPWGMKTESSGWLEPDPAPSRDEVDWELYLGPAPWRPFNKTLLRGGEFEKGGGLVGGGVLEWGSHCVDLCQWANDADHTAAVEYWPEGDQVHARYANGVKLVVRDEGWLPLGSCPVRFEGDAGWVETGDNGELEASPKDLIAGPRPRISGYPANFHVRDFLACVRSRGQPRANAQVACWSHITCHALNIALFLKRRVRFDPVTCEFIGDPEANRLRSEALREPWRV